MSPSEHDLRAAMRDGEDGNGPDVDRIVAAGAAARTRRRTQFVTVGVAVVLVGAIGTGGGLLLTRDDSNRASSPTNFAASGKAERSLSSSSIPARTNPLASPAIRSSGSGVLCPSAFPTRTLPGGGGTGQFGATGALFAAPSASIVVCAYGAPGSSTRVRTELTGADAIQLQDSLESASRTRSDPACTGDIEQYVILGVTATGTRLRTITATVGLGTCSGTVTNGTAVRYGWHLSADIVSQLQQSSAPARLPITTPSGGHNIGSPPSR